MIPLPLFKHRNSIASVRCSHIHTQVILMKENCDSFHSELGIQGVKYVCLRSIFSMPFVYIVWPYHRLGPNINSSFIHKTWRKSPEANVCLSINLLTKYYPLYANDITLKKTSKYYALMRLSAELSNILKMPGSFHFVFLQLKLCRAQETENREETVNFS